jgi:hypothetical protein
MAKSTERVGEALDVASTIVEKVKTHAAGRPGTARGIGIDRGVISGNLT